jgi:hypothetical protein
MGILTLLQFLIGRRQAILDIAASKQAIWLGLLFVLSAGLAREYDGEDLLHEPWHLLIPLAASLTTSTILYCMLWIVLRGWATFPNEWRTFFAFVSLYWMTAPLAWLYAIPVERFMSPADAIMTNYWLLAIVAFWRVVLIIRVSSVLFGAPIGQLIFPVLLFAHSVLVVLTIMVPTPIFAIMGGVRYSEADRVIAAVALLTMATTPLVWPFLAIGTLISIFAVRVREPAPSLRLLPPLSVKRSAWGLAAAALLIGCAILPLTQPEQIRRWQAEKLLRSGRIGEGLEYMAKFERHDFPPHWDPPPRLGYAEQSPRFLDVIAAITERSEQPNWVVEEYLRKFHCQIEEKIRSDTALGRVVGRRLGPLA